MARTRNQGSLTFDGQAHSYDAQAIEDALQAVTLTVDAAVYEIPAAVVADGISAMVRSLLKRNAETPASILKLLKEAAKSGGDIKGLSQRYAEALARDASK